MCILQEMRENCKNFLSLCVLKDGCMHVFVRFVRFFLFFKKKKIFSFDLFANYEIDGKWEIGVGVVFGLAGGFDAL